MSEPSANWAIATALLLGSLRALGLWRAHARVDAVNAVVLSMLGQGRAEGLSAVLRNSGSGLYLTIAEQLTHPLEKFGEADEQALRQRLERDARMALAAAGSRIRRFAWLDVLVLVAIVYSGISGLLVGLGSWVSSLGLLAATLLWWANVRAARRQTGHAALRRRNGTHRNPGEASTERWPVAWNSVARR